MRQFAEAGCWINHISRTSKAKWDSLCQNQGRNPVSSLSVFLCIASIAQAFYVYHLLSPFLLALLQCTKRRNCYNCTAHDRSDISRCFRIKNGIFTEFSSILACVCTAACENYCSSVFPRGTGWPCPRQAVPSELLMWNPAGLPCFFNLGGSWVVGLTMQAGRDSSILV